ncbi:MAG: glycosyltransferase [Microcoleaceae cyanobacterium]
MRIAIITSGFLPVIDGVTVSSWARLQKLSQWGHQVLLFCPDYSQLAEIYPNWKDYIGSILPGVRVINLPSTPFMDLDFERNVAFWAYPQLQKELEQFQPDIIHVDEPERLFFGFFRRPGIHYSKKKSIPCVSFFRTNFLDYAEDYFPFSSTIISIIQWIFKQFFIWIYNAYDLTLVSSRITHPKLIKMGIKNSHYENLLGFDASQFHPNLRQTDFFKQHYQLADIDQKIKLIFLGRLTPDKGWDFTLKLLPELANIIDLDQVAWMIAGDGPIADQINQQFKQFTPHIHLLGRVTPENVPALLANCDLHITTSEKETRGLTVLEAFAAGIPVLAPAAGGVMENIKPGYNGLLYQPQNAIDFIQKLQQLIENPSLRQEMGKNGHQDLKEFSWDNTVKNLINIWENQIKSRENY